MIAPSLAEIKPVYNPGEEKLVSLDVLKLYRGAYMVRQAPIDIDPDLWTDKGKLTEQPEIPVGDVVLQETCLGPVTSEVMDTPDANIPMILDSPEEMEMREGIHERIQAEIPQRPGKKHFKLNRS